MRERKSLVKELEKGRGGMMSKGNRPAFPSALVQHDQGPFKSDQIFSGITVRQLYKCFSLRTWRSASMAKEGADAIAKNIGMMADALLKEDEEYGKQ